MKTTGLTILAFLFIFSSLAGSVEKTIYFSNYKVNQQGIYQTVTFSNTKLSARPGEPALPYQAIALMLPPGETATGIEIITENEVLVPGTFNIYPQQYSLPLSKPGADKFIKNEGIYRFNGKYPSNPAMQVSTMYMNGYAFALSAFTPVTYNPAAKTLSYFSKVTIRISTKPDSKAVKAMNFLTTSENALKRVRIFAQNPEMMESYPKKSLGTSSYQYLVVTPAQFVDQYDSLLDFYNETGVHSQVKTTEFIDANYPGHDLQQKIRNCIKQEVTLNNIEYVLLGGDVEHVPFRAFYDTATSPGVLADSLIPADIYYSALDGEWNDSNLIGGNINWWGEPGEDDLLPDVSVARFPVSTSAELQHMVHKSLYYQKYPVLGELTKPLMAGEYLYSPPPTYGGDYMELLIDQHADSGYYTHGIPSAENDITRLYDSPSYVWSKNELISTINQGKSFIHHLGHSNWDYMMRMGTSDITNQNFSQLNGVTHNFTLCYTQGCIDGAFDYQDCIAEKAVTINNFLVGGVFNSRYGWFNQGQSDGPSQHLQREFVSALYNDTLEYQFRELGSAHLMSKIKTAPWVGLPGEFEPGAQRWVHYDCNVLGDPAMKIWITEPVLSVFPANQDVPSTAGTVTFNVISNDSWVAATDATWCIVTPSGNDNGSILASYTANPLETQRIANISVKITGMPAVTVTVTQAPLVSVEELTTSGIHIYPNPAKNNINISFNLKNQGQVRIKLSNMMGQMVKEVAIPKQASGNYHTSLDVSGLVAGVYSCIIEQGSMKEIQKVLIIK